MNELMKMLVGRVPSGGHAWKQITATAELAETCYAFIPVGGDVTFTTIEAANEDVSDANAGGTYYEGYVYTGQYTKLVPASGTILCYLGKNK
jgi:hypothetical protein